jgi:F0F1-type ATP synthase membrane subunit c/vacuolar-type H+-ATPase subunit K
MNAMRRKLLLPLLALLVAGAAGAALQPKDFARRWQVLASCPQAPANAAACEGAARNPGAAGRIQTMMILGLALIESLVLFALLIVFTVVKGA